MTDEFDIDAGIRKFIRTFQDMVLEATDRDEIDPQLALLDFIHANPDIRLFLEQAKAEAERVKIRWPMPEATTDWPLTENAFLFVCRHNGADPAKVPNSWRYAPNPAMQQRMNYFGSLPVDVQMERVRWSRRKTRFLPWKKYRKSYRRRMRMAWRRFKWRS